jgi:hypothetical protein
MAMGKFGAKVAFTALSLGLVLIVWMVRVAAAGRPDGP